MAAHMLRARTRPCRNACCAVGGYGFPVLGSGIEAQSPTAQTPGQSSTSIYSLVANRPAFLPTWNGIQDWMWRRSGGPNQRIGRYVRSVAEFDDSVPIAEHS